MGRLPNASARIRSRSELRPMQSLLLLSLASTAGQGSFVPNHLFVSSFATETVVELSPGAVKAGELQDSSEPIGPMGIAFGPDGRLYVSADHRNRVLVFDASGTIV